MKTRTAFTLAALTLAALAAAPDRALAQAGFSIAAGAAAPTGDLGNRVDLGYTLAASLGFQPSMSPLALRIDGMFNEFDNSASSERKTSIWSATGNAIVGGAGGLGPYLIGGLGVYNVRQPAFASGTVSRSDVGFNVGAGYRFALTGFSAFAEARWHKVTDTDVTFIPIVFGVTF
jgi:hypothetical protein